MPFKSSPRSGDNAAIANNADIEDNDSTSRSEAPITDGGYEESEDEDDDDESADNKDEDDESDSDEVESDNESDDDE